MSRRPTNSILPDHPAGIRYSELQRQNHETDSSFKLNTIAGSIYDLDVRFADVEKPDRGLYRMRVSDVEGNAVVAIPGPNFQPTWVISAFTV